MKKLEVPVSAIKEEIIKAELLVTVSQGGAGVLSGFKGTDEQLEQLSEIIISNWLKTQKTEAYLARRKDWAKGEFSPFKADLPLAWAESKIPLIVNPEG